MVDVVVSNAIFNPNEGFVGDVVNLTFKMTNTTASTIVFDVDAYLSEVLIHHHRRGLNPNSSYTTTQVVTIPDLVAGAWKNLRIRANDEDFYFSNAFKVLGVEEPPQDFFVSDLVLTPNAGVAGDQITVTFNLFNTTDYEEVLWVYFWWEEEQWHGQPFTVPAHTNMPVLFKTNMHTGLSVGFHTLETRVRGYVYTWSNAFEVTAPPPMISINNVWVVPPAAYLYDVVDYKIEVANADATGHNVDVEIVVGGLSVDSGVLNVPGYGTAVFTAHKWVDEALSVGFHDVVGHADGHVKTVVNGFEVLAEEVPPEPVEGIGDCVVMPDKPALGSTVTVYCTLTNSGDASGTWDYSFAGRGFSVFPKSVTIPAGASIVTTDSLIINPGVALGLASLMVTFGEASKYFENVYEIVAAEEPPPEPEPDIQVVIGLILPYVLYPGEVVGVDWIVRNVGGAGGTWSHSMRIGLPAQVVIQKAYPTLSIGAGDFRDFSDGFTLPVDAPEGLYQVEVLVGDGVTLLIDAFQVLSGTAPPPPPEEEGWLTTARRFVYQSLPAWLFDIPNLGVSVSNLFGNITSILNTSIPDALQAAKDFAQTLVDGIVAVIPQWIIDAANWVRDRASTVWNWITGVGQDAVNWVADTGSDIYSWMTTTATSAVNWVNNTGSSIYNWMVSTANNAINWVNNTGSSIYNWMVTTATAAVNWVNSTGSNIYNWMVSTATDVVNWVNDVGVSISNWVSEDAIPAINDYYENFPSLHNSWTDFILHPWTIVEAGIVYILQRLHPPKEEIEEEWTKVRELSE